MRALAIPRSQARRAHPATGTRRGHLQLVGPGFVPSPVTVAGDEADRAPSTAAARVATRPGVRLTARGRMVRSALALVAGMVLAIGVGGWLGSATGAAEYTGPVDQVSVGAGDTVWGIAAGTAPAGTDVRDVVDDILHLNGLSSAEVSAGQELLVPAG